MKSNRQIMRSLANGFLFFLSVAVLPACIAAASCYKPYRGDLNTFSLSPPARCVSPGCLRSKNNYIKRFPPYLIEVFRVGHSRLISFPTASVFNGRSANFTRCAFSLLDTVAHYLKHEDMSVLEVDAYTDNVGSPRRAKLMTIQQADAIVKYLTGKGVPANFIYAEGWGQATPLSSNATKKGRRYNRRIELRYRIID